MNISRQKLKPPWNDAGVGKARRHAPVAAGPDLLGLGGRDGEKRRHERADQRPSQPRDICPHGYGSAIWRRSRSIIRDAMKYVSAFLILSTVVIAQPAQAPATLVLRNGKVVTVDAAMPEAQAIAIRGDRIAAVGTNEQHPAVHRARDAGDRSARASWRFPA